MTDAKGINMDDKEHKRKSRSESFFTIYKNIHTEGKPDHDIETLYTKAREYLALKRYFERPKVLDFYGFTEEFIKHSNGKKFEENAFKVLQNVFQKLEDYGLRLLKRPWRREFYTIKLYTTFFKLDIESKLPSAVRVLELYGYKDVSQNTVKMTADSLDSHRISFVCFELFLSQIELGAMYEICTKIEKYTSDFTLSDVLKVRRKTKGDVNEAVDNYLKENPDINRVKRMKTDDTESRRKSRDSFEKSNKLPVEGEGTSRTGFDNERITGQGKTSNRDTKYPPIPGSYSNLPSSSDHHGFVPVTSSAKVRHISSSAPYDNFSDAELYGHGDVSSSSQDKDNNIPMDTEQPQDWNRALYGHDDRELYVDMSGSGANGNYYEMMYNPDNYVPSCTTLPPPQVTYVYSSSNQGIPPPTYDQATQIPGNDWVMVGDKDSDGLSNNISAMNIGGNEHVSRTSSEVVRVQGVHNTHDIQRLKAASADRMGVTTTCYSNVSYYLTEPQGTSTKTRAFGSSVSKEHSGDVKGMVDTSSERSVLNGSDKDYKIPTTSFTKGFDSRQPEKSALYPFETPGDSTKGKTDCQTRSYSLSSYDRMSSTKATEPYLKEHLTRSGPGEVISKRMSDPNVPITTPPYLTSSYSKGSSTTAPSNLSSKTQSAILTRSQTRATASSKSDVMSEPLQGTSKTTQQMAERYNKENCIICSSKATHYCLMCKKRSCKSCTTVVARLSCDSYKEHRLVEISPTTNNEKADLGSKDVCSFCGVSASSHNCIYCSKKSCSTCHTTYTKDPCVPAGISAFHHFVNQQQQKSTSDKQETTSQKQTMLSSKDKRPDPLPHGHVTGENYCEFCGLAANLICRPCLKTICDTCKYYYKQDLCPPTKREHQFENINEESSNTNEAGSKDSSSPWSCERCTFFNSSSNRICAVCATSRGVHRVDFPKSGSRKCQNCTYANEEGATICKMCSGTFGLDNPESYI